MNNDESPDNVRELLSNLQFHLKRLHEPACNLLDTERLASWNAMVRSIAAQPDSAEKRGLLRTLNHLLEQLCPRPLHPRPSLHDMYEARDYIDHQTKVLDDVRRQHDAVRRQHKHVARVNAQLAKQVTDLTWDKGECERRTTELERMHAQAVAKDRDRGRRRLDALRQSLDDAERAHAACQWENADVQRDARQVAERNRRLADEVDALHRRVASTELTWAKRREASDRAHEQGMETLRRELQVAIIRRQECEQTRELEQSECDAKIAQLSRELRSHVDAAPRSPTPSIASTTSEYAPDDLTQDDIDRLTDVNRDWCLNSKAVKRHSDPPDGLTLDDLTCECYAHHSVSCNTVADATYKARCVATRGSPACTTHANFEEGHATWDGAKFRHFKMARRSSRMTQKPPASKKVAPTPPTERAAHVLRSGRVRTTPGSGFVTVPT